MPELPEVEVILQGLAPYIIGRTIVSTWYSGKKLRHPFAFEQIEKRLTGAAFSGAERRAKNLILQLDNRCFLVCHMGMTGKLGIFTPDSPVHKHDHIIFTLNDRQQVRFNDVRRFGSIQLFKDLNREQLEELAFAQLGVEPFSPECNGDYFFQLAKGRSTPVKSFLMDNRIVVGIGNIYANETLFRAGIHPSRPAGKVLLREWKQLHTELVQTLEWAIECGGSTISDFLNASGQQGYFQANFRVYGRHQQKCPTCSREIEKSVIGGRATFFCRGCQK